MLPGVHTLGGYVWNKWSHILTNRSRRVPAPKRRNGPKTFAISCIFFILKNGRNHILPPPSTSINLCTLTGNAGCVHALQLASGESMRGASVSHLVYFTKITKIRRKTPVTRLEESFILHAITLYPHSFLMIRVPSLKHHNLSPPPSPRAPRQRRIGSLPGLKTCLRKVVQWPETMFSELAIFSLYSLSLASSWPSTERLYCLQVWLCLFKDYSTSGCRGGPPWPPDLETPDIQFGGPVYNLRVKQWILGPFFHIFSKKISSLALLSITFTFHILLVSLCTSFHISSSYVHTSKLYWLKP